MGLRSSFVLPAVAAVLATGACRRAAPLIVSEVVAVPRGAVPADPADPAWRDAPIHIAPLILQDLVEPRLLQASTSELRVQAITDGARVGFRLEWADATKDDLPQLGKFSDACAIQLPAKVRPDVPAPQMGEAGRAVEITYWRASWQAVVDGRGDTIQDLYPAASVDHYPFEAASLPEGSEARREMASRYAPARALGNQTAGPREQPVEDLLAEGPGTLGPGPALDSTGRGRRSARGWAVVLSRRLPAGLAPGGRAHVAFAVWEGSREEVGARKMRTGWIPILVEGRP
jgi:DMSO reductase family type II enzyme heme b subunit